MELFVGILIGACLAVTVLVILGFRAMRTKRSGSDLTQLTFDPDLMVRVRALAASGERVEAIKVLRESTPNLGLGQATLLVDRMAKSATKRPAAPNQDPAAEASTPDAPVEDVPSQEPPWPPDGPRTASPWDDAPSSSAVDLEVELEVRALRSDGKTADAVRLLQTHTGWDKSTAEDYISGL